MVLRHTVALIVIMVAIVLVLATTHPDSVPLGLLMGIFILLFAFVFEVVVLMGIGLRKSGIINWKQSRVRKVAAGAAALPLFLLVLQSIGQLTIRDILLAGGLCVLLYLYLGRLTSRSA